MNPFNTQKIDVLDPFGNWLGMTTPSRARRLLKSKRAFIYQKEPFVLRLNQFKMNAEIPVGEDSSIGISNLEEMT